MRRYNIHKRAKRTSVPECLDVCDIEIRVEHGTLVSPGEDTVHILDRCRRLHYMYAQYTHSIYLFVNGELTWWYNGV